MYNVDLQLQPASDRLGGPGIPLPQEDSDASFRASGNLIPAKMDLIIIR